ncbi:DUF2332 domain-containing protein [soil metagenome]
MAAGLIYPLVGLGDRFRAHARATEGMYSVLLRAMAADWESGGPVRDICRGWEDAPRGALVQLRLLAGVHRLVLSGRAPALVRYFPNLGGTADPRGAWPTMRRELSGHLDELRQALTIAPQTNEPGRAAALLVGLQFAVRHTGLNQIRLYEPGASGGLNLLVDRFRIEGHTPGQWWSGPTDSPLRMPDAISADESVRWPGPLDFEIVERGGCDLAPVDVTTEAGRIRLASFVWPDQLERHRQLAAAIEVARSSDSPAVAVQLAPASRWLAAQLRSAPSAGVLTVVWQSVTRLYWPAAEVARVAGLITAAGARMPLAHLALEYPNPESDQPAQLGVSIYLPGRPTHHAVLATVSSHGGPVRLVPTATPR